MRYHAPAAALAFGRHLAREGVQLASILRAYRLGQEVLFARAAELALENPELGGQFGTWPAWLPCRFALWMVR